MPSPMQVSRREVRDGVRRWGGLDGRGRNRITLVMAGYYETWVERERHQRR